jgi:GT2 family glycosyltransferase
MAGQDPGTIEMAGRLDDVTLSVVIPTFNRSAMVPRAVDSVLAQSGANVLEVIVVDDGSSDGTGAVLHARYDDDPRVRLVSIPHSGVSAARNTGFRATRGELVCFLDSDDEWTPDASATAMQVFATYPELVFVSLDGSFLPTHDSPRVPRAMRTNAPGWSHAGFARAPLAPERIRLRGSQQDTAMLRGDFFPAIVHGDLFQVNGMFMRRDAAARAGLFNEWMDHYEDWDFFSRLCLQGPGAYLDYEGYQRDIGHPGRLAPGHPDTDMPRRHLYILHSLRRRFPEATKHYADNFRDALIDAQYQMGVELARSAHPRRASRYLLRCIRQRYKVGRSLIHLMRSLLPVPS